MSGDDKALIWLIGITAVTAICLFAAYRFTGGVWPT